MDETSTSIAETPLEKLVAQTSAVYSLPWVALDVLRLSANDQIDAGALTECAERDPGLTAKILRVVNSPVFALSCQVSNLHQAVALLGAKPLRMLVLGFSLPDRLIADLAGDQLRRYWTRNLTRAVAARVLSERLWKRPGENVFVAALLQEVGFLVMLRELGPPYAHFSQRVEQENRSLEALELESLGFTHRELSAELLRKWRLPVRIVEAIRMRPQMLRLARLHGAEGEMPQILHLADLLTTLVGERRLAVLPDLLAAGEAYCKLTREQLTEIVATLQPQVDELARAMVLELETGRDYLQMLVDAHARLSLVSEEAVAQFALARDEQEMCDALLAESVELGTALRRFFEKRERAAELKKGRGRPDAPHQPKKRFANATTLAPAAVVQLTSELRQCSADCRARRTELSLLLFDANGAAYPRSEGKELASRLRDALEKACGSLDLRRDYCESLGGALTAAILSDCDRREAVLLARRLIDICRRETFHDWPPAAKRTPMVHVGVATATHISKNFSVESLLSGAERCLAAAKSCGGSAVKSIEVF
jgi:HD-like signal output (HDOD) protein/GGDEF domain-containing protein